MKPSEMFKCKDCGASIYNFLEKKLHTSLPTVEDLEKVVAPLICSEKEIQEYKDLAKNETTANGVMFWERLIERQSIITRKIAQSILDFLGRDK